MVADTIKKKRCPVVEQRLAKKDEVRKLIYQLLFRKRWRERGDLEKKESECGRDSTQRQRNRQRNHQ